MTAERRRGIVVRTNGLLFDESAFRAWLDQMDRRQPTRARITRLSLTDPASLAIAGELAARSGR
jgi:hypothetical protein